MLRLPVPIRFVKVADQVQADVIYAADETALPTPDTPAPVKWVDENLLTMASGIFVIGLRISGFKNAHVEEYFYPGKPLQTIDMVCSGQIKQGWSVLDW